uniref:Uncharacterized protein n=1 Tax=Tanacetum cinerariifolium TaxID=118510 RepID=A0A6L2J5P3_TANCI|nr:hypothetical protein [Tanacetum cinerariifolium]
MNTTQAQQKALDDALVSPALIREMQHATQATVLVHKSSIRFTINKKKVSLDVDTFREILKNCLKISGQEFKDLPLEHDILSFIRDLGNTGNITYLTDMNVDYLHQRWREFATILNKCLNLLFQIENKDAKKTNKVSYPIFTRIIIDYFMSKDQSISQRNKLFWHTARDDTMFTSRRCITRHEKTQVYGAILPKEITNQEMLESEAYKTYYAFASGEKTPKPKIKTKAKVTKSDKKKQPAKKPKAKGLAVLSELKVPDEQQQKTSGMDEGTGTIPRVPDVPIYDSESDKESWGDSDDKNDFEEEADINDDDSDDNDESDDERTKSDSDLLNLDNPSLADNDIASLMDTIAYHATAIPKITSSFTRPTPPPPLFFTPLSQPATPTLTPTLTPTALETTTSLLALPNFAFVFKFNERVTNLEKDMSKIEQVDKYAQALSSIPAIVDRYTNNKLGEVITKAIQAHSFDCREEAQAKKKEYIELVDSTSLEATILTRSSSQPRSSYEAAATLFEFKLTKILIDKMEKNKSFDVADYKRELYDALVKSYNTDKDIFGSYGKQQDQEFVMGDNDEQLVDKELTKSDWFKKPKRPPTPDLD